jgi:hypothetical protein
MDKGDSMSYEGWKNYSTWNVSLWLHNEKGLTNMMLEFLKDNNPVYEEMIYYMGLEDSMTADKVAWLSPELNHDELNDMLMEEKKELFMYYQDREEVAQ